MFQRALLCKSLYNAIFSYYRTQPIVSDISSACLHRQISQVRIQRDPKIFKKPLAYKPERWLQDDLELQEDIEKVHGGKSQMANAFLAFAQGTHSCLGMNLANLELRTVTALLVKHFNIRYNGPVPEQTGFVIRAKKNPLIEMHPRRAD